MKGKGIIFGRGYLGTRLSEYLGINAVGREHDPLNYLALEEFLLDTKPYFVINAVGATGRPNIDWCETHKLETLESNIIAAANLSRACNKQGIYFIHLGSGCIYEGDNNGKGFSEHDEPNFYDKQFYGMTKILAEKCLSEQDLILRIRMPIDDRPHERNLIDKLRKYTHIINTPNSMTTVPHMLPAIKRLIENNKRGIYNLVNPCTISAKEIMDLYKEIIDPSHEYKVMSLNELNKITAGIRSNCTLNTDKLSSEGIFLPKIHNAVRECLNIYKKNDLKK
jgi:3,5-epimerase/4-reductase